MTDNPGWMEFKTVKDLEKYEPQAAKKMQELRAKWKREEKDGE